MPGTPQTLPVPPPVSVPTLLNAIRLAAGSGGGGSGTGTVTSVSVTTQNGVSATVANPTTTPALAFTLGAITPTTVQLSGSVSGTTLLQSPPVAGSAVITFPSVTGTLAIIGNTVSQFAAGGTLSSLTGFSLRSTGAAFDLSLATSEVLTAGRTLSFNVGDADRTLTIPATGTAALLGTANIFTQSNRFTADFALRVSKFGTALAVYDDDNVTLRARIYEGRYIGGDYSDINNGVSVGGGPLGLKMRSSYTIQWSNDSTFFGTIDTIIARKAPATIQMGADAAGVTNQMFTAASRITSDGVGANLTIAGGNGRGAAGGSLILSTYDTAGAATIGTLRSRLVIDTAGAFSFPVTTAVTAEVVVSDATWPVTINGVAYKICLKA
jgi:hypothetical protein